MMDAFSPNLTEDSYKMSEDDIRRLIKFRASNELLFTGKRNSAKIAWSVILRALDLQGKLTAEQIAKKWDNLRSKYKELKQPDQSADGEQPGGGGGESWPWFRMMDDAMHGRLYNSRMALGLPGDGRRRDDDNDVLEFLIKTEMDDSAAAESADGGESAEGLPVGWRRMNECSYKMSEEETERLIKIRAANEAIFTGKKNSAKLAWRAVLHELGLQGKLSTEQLAKKWDNLKRRYKELKFPPRGVESNPSSWPWFQSMDDAMEGRLAGAAPALTPVFVAEDEDCEMLPAPRKRARRSRTGVAEFLSESELDMLICGHDKSASLALGDLRRGVADLGYRLTDEDIRKLVELRAANEALFTGRRNSAKPAWRAIVKEMGLTGKITPDQVAKKWDNLKTKFKDLKFPPQGAEPQGGAASWPWFQLMSDALEGRLAGKGVQVAPVWSSEDDAVSGSPPSADAQEAAIYDMDDARAVADLCRSDDSITYIDASGEECAAPPELAYKMSEQDTRRLITLRAANEDLFTGRRNAAKAAWKAIIRQLDLQGKVSTYQVAKKWDNLKRRFKDLKYPPTGMDNMTEGAASWPWFHLMNDAMEGRLVCNGSPLPAPVSQVGGPEPPVGGGGDRAVLEQQRAALEQERMALDQERASARAEREWLERERVALERDRALLELERAALGRERELLDQSVIPNCQFRSKTSRMKTFTANQLDEIKDPSALFYILPFQKGYLVNWDVQRKVWDHLFGKEMFKVDFADSSVIISEPYFNFTSIQESMNEILFEEYRFQSALRINAGSLSARRYFRSEPYELCCLVVDSGFSFTHIAPYCRGSRMKDAIRRINVGGKLLTNHLKEIISYRQLHVMDETHVINQVKEDVCFVSQDFYRDMAVAQLKGLDNTVMRDYVLPDFSGIKKGFCKPAEQVVQSGKYKTGEQILRLANERFAVPEILFHPSDVGIQEMGIPEAIVDSVRSLSQDMQPHMYGNIILTGGNVLFPGFRERLEAELRALVPAHVPVKVTLPDNPITYAWEGGKLLANDPDYEEMVVTRDDYEENGHFVCEEKFDI